jgi:hypothetical protein
MFFRAKRAGGHQYLQLVENRRIDGQHRQTVVATLGRVDELAASGALERLLRSGARACESAMLLSAAEGGAAATLACRRIGPALVFERLWSETGCRAVLEQLAGTREHGFALERAIFLSVLHRLIEPGSDRAADKWRRGYAIDGVARLELHHLYRAMGWLGEELAEQDGAGLAARTTKDLVEEALFARRRTLLSDLAIVFYDTTSLYFEGRGGETLGRYGHSKDHRRDLKQMILAVVIDEAGRPICSEMWPGNVTDVTTLLPVVDRLRRRFGIARCCVVADRGMISAKVLAELERRSIEYVIGVRERRTAEVASVLADQTPYVPLSIAKAAGRGTLDLQIKEVARSTGVGRARQRRRYIVCFNPAEAAKDAAVRQSVVDSLRNTLRHGDKAVIGAKGYKRFVKTVGDRRFAIDEARVAADAKYDGIYVLRTNARITALQAALRYRQRYLVEDIFRTAKSLLATRPIFHKCDDTIRGHVFCSFLALVLRHELMRRLSAAGLDLEWADVVSDLDRLVETEIAQDAKRFLLRGPAPGAGAAICRVVGVALPPTIRKMPATAPPPHTAPAQPPTGRGAKPAADPANRLF